MSSIGITLMKLGSVFMVIFGLLEIILNIAVRYISEGLLPGIISTLARLVGIGWGQEGGALSLLSTALFVLKIALGLIIIGMGVGLYAKARRSEYRRVTMGRFAFLLALLTIVSMLTFSTTLALSSGLGLLGMLVRRAEQEGILDLESLMPE